MTEISTYPTLQAAIEDGAIKGEPIDATTLADHKRGVSRVIGTGADYGEVFVPLEGESG